MNTGLIISLAAAEIMAVIFMIKLINIKKNTDLQTVIQYATLSIYFLLTAVVLKM